MIYEICYFRSLVDKISEYLYGQNVDKSILGTALQREQNPTATLSLLALHHNRRNVGLLSLSYQHLFSQCDTVDDYGNYFQYVKIVPDTITDCDITTRYYDRYNNYYQCFNRLLHDRQIPLLEMTGHDIISYCHTIYCNTHQLSEWNDEYHNVTYIHRGRTNTISVRHLLLVLLTNQEPLTHEPFDQVWYDEQVNRYHRELCLFDDFYRRDK